MLTSARRRTLDELVQRYRRNPDLGTDIYVEGSNDKQLVDMYFREKRFNGAIVYSIDSVEVGDEHLFRAGLNPGSCRNRVIVLKDLLEKSGVPLQRIKFVIDRDQEDLCSLGELLEGIHLSDWGALEMALVHESALQRLLDTFAGGKLSLEVFTEAVFKVSRCIYLVRATAKRLNFSVKILAPGDFINFSGNNIDFNFDAYVERVLVVSALRGKLEEFLAEMFACSNEVDARRLPREVTANDHDVLSIMLKIIKILGGLANRAEGDVRALLLMAIDYNLIDGQVVFRSLTN